MRPMLVCDLAWNHEGLLTIVGHDTNPNRGVQLYPACVQIKVEGSGTVTLPPGVSCKFPGLEVYIC